YADRAGQEAGEAFVDLQRAAPDGHRAKSDEIYVNRNAIANTKNKSLNEGQNVEFSIYRSSHGLSAADVIAF
ncbi:cold-shock protein, partial [Serratia sp. CY74308]|uniref:cold-shock protein n=1 Tax=Serratia sp. CY74308 TaxID=3383675 RepID=UPI003FA0EDC6